MRANAAISIGIAAALCLLAAITFLTLTEPLLDSFGFRQTQTASGAYSILHDRAFIDYFTPVLGAPWALPYEFPVYQWLVVLLSLLGIPLDPAGRVVALACYLGAVWTGYVIVRRLLPGDFAARIFALLALTSPLYVFWSRTFMVETCALFFGMAWLACILRPLDRDAVPWLIAAIPLGILAGLAKATTWPAFAAAYAIYAGSELLRTRRLPILPLALAAATTAITLVAVLIWTRHTDLVKEANPFAGNLTSTSLREWNYGTWAQLFSRDLWLDIMPARMLVDTLGYGWPVLLVAVGLADMRQRPTVLAVVAVVLFLLPLVLFTNLQIIHEYYLTSNAIFASAAAAFLISQVTKARRPYLAVGLSVILVAGALVRIVSYQWPLAVRPLSYHPFYVAAELVRKNTPENSALIVVGIDWSSEIHYYANRKGIAFPLWGGIPRAEQLIADPDVYMGGLKTAALVDCRAVHVRYYPALEAVIGTFVEQFAQSAKRISVPDQGCAVYVRSGSTAAKE